MGEQNAQNDASERGPLAEDSSEQDAKTATEQKTRPNDQEQRGKSKNDVIPQSALADHADNESNDHTETSRDQGDPFRPPKITKVRRRWRTLNNHLMIAFTAIIAGSTLAYAIVAGWQLWTMHGQLNQIQLSSRAWVACYPGSCDKIVVGDKFSFDLVLANSGATPGNKVNVGCAVLIESKDYDIEAYTSARKERAMAQLVRDQTVPPSGRVRVPHRCTIKQLDDDALTKIKNGELVVYVFGEVTYEDVFRNKRVTTYCHDVDPSKWQLRIYKQHNHME